jgi:predicted dehydrogenase
MGPALRAGIVGTGFIGAVHARSALLAGARVTGVAASTPARAEQAAARLGAGRAFASAEELVRSDDVDVVHVCAPNHLHVPLAEAALAAGKHVVCEKPIALDAEGAQRLVDAAEAAGRQAAVPFVYRYYPTVREARERVGRGDTGPLHLLHGSYLQDWLLRRRTTTGGSTPGSAARRAPSPTSARTGATWPSSCPGTASPGSAPG